MKQLFIIITFLIQTSTLVFAHPHTFIEVKPTIKIVDNQINNLRIKWTLDEMTSMMLLMEFDKNSDGKIDKEENTFIYENYFSSLENQNFYMQIHSNKKELFITPTNFKASIEKNRVVYSFDIKKSMKIDDVKINFFDDTLFVGMMLEKQHIKVVGLDKKHINSFKKQTFGVN